MIMRKNGIGCLLTIFLLFTTILSAQQGQFINWKDYSGKVYVQLVDGMLQISLMRCVFNTKSPSTDNYLSGFI